MSGMIRRSTVDSRKGSTGIRDPINSAPVILPTSQRNPTPSPGYHRMTKPYRSFGFLPRGGVSLGPLVLWRGSPESHRLAPEMSRVKCRCNPSWLFGRRDDGGRAGPALLMGSGQEIAVRFLGGTCGRLGTRHLGGGDQSGLTSRRPAAGRRPGAAAITSTALRIAKRVPMPDGSSSPSSRRRFSTRRRGPWTWSL